MVFIVVILFIAFEPRCMNQPKVVLDLKYLHESARCGRGFENAPLMHTEGGFIPESLASPDNIKC